VDTVVVVHCSSQQLFEAISANPKLHGLIKGFRNPDLLFIDPQQLPLLREQLSWAGLNISDQLETTLPRSWTT
jgi:hypothetical protein